MAKFKTIKAEKPTKSKQFNKNSSFSGLEVKKSLKSRRKSLATVLPTPSKFKSVDLSDWSVSEVIKEENVTPLKTKMSDIPASTKTPKSSKKLVEETVRKTPGTILKRKKIGLQVTEPKTSLISLSSSKMKKNASFLNEGQGESKHNLNIKFKNFLKYDISKENVETAVSSVIKFASENPALKNQLFEDNIPLFLQITCVKVPKGKPRLMRIPLPNSLVQKEQEVCLIVSEVKGINNIDHEKHQDHYKELFEKKGVTNINKIMTVHELRTEYETFELKRKLVDLYDIFLVDGRISGKIVKKCGKIFYNKRKVPIPVKMQATKLKEQIDSAISKSPLHLHLKGDSYNVQFGHSGLTNDQLIENVFAVVKYLINNFPGSFQNIKSLYVNGWRASSVPIYMSLKNPNEVKVPKLTVKKLKAYKTVKGELSTTLNSDVIVRPSGEIIVINKDSGANVTDIDHNPNSLKRKNKGNETEESSQKKRKKTDDITLKYKPKKMKESAAIEEDNDSEKVATKKKVQKTRKQTETEENIVKIKKKVQKARKLSETKENVDNIVSQPEIKLCLNKRKFKKGNSKNLGQKEIKPTKKKSKISTKVNKYTLC